MLPFLFFPRNHMVCPYCLHDLSFVMNEKLEKCKVCNKEIPPLYKRDYRIAPPLIIQLLGWRQVGKTSFLQALTFNLLRMNMVWPNLIFQPTTDPTLRFIRSVKEYLFNGRMPKVTHLGQNEAYIMLCHDMERWGSRTVVFRDCAGEIFDPLNITQFEAVPYLLHAPTTLLLISLADLVEMPNFSMDQLISSYINTLLTNKIDPRKTKRNMVVVFTKADLIKDLPTPLYDYYNDDPIGDAIITNKEFVLDSQEMQNYLIKMNEISGLISDWINSRPSGRSLILQAKKNHIDLRFSLISSTGQNTNSGGQLEWKPRRVIDPFIWALEFQSY